MREPVVDRIDFIHRTFQEYLAAKRIIAVHDIGIILSHAHEPTWREVVILATGHAADGGETILKGLLERADNESKHRHYLSLLAVSCLETATAFSGETRQIIQDRLNELVPPRNITEAKALASAGELALPYLGGHTRVKSEYAAACVRALAMIGGDAALGILAQYASDRRRRVNEELFRSGQYFDFNEYTRRVLSQKFEITLSQWADDLTPLGNLKALRSLTLWECARVSDLTPIAGLTALESLHLHVCNGVSDLTPIASLAALRSLYLSRCSGIADITALGELSGLESLALIGCHHINDLTPVASLTALESLSVSGCDGVTDLTPLAHLSTLTSLQLSGCNGVTDLTPLANLSTLKSLQLSGCNGVTDLTPLAKLSALKSLNLWGSRGITDVAPIANLTGLESLGLGYCIGVTSLAPLAALIRLKSVNLSGCEGVTDLTPLAGLIALRTVLVSHQQLIEGAPPRLRPRLTSSPSTFWHLARI